jgi:hypothetical protein
VVLTVFLWVTTAAVLQFMRWGVTKLSVKGVEQWDTGEHHADFPTAHAVWGDRVRWTAAEAVAERLSFDAVWVAVVCRRWVCVSYREGTCGVVDR